MSLVFCSSVLLRWGFDDLLEKMWSYLDMKRM